MNSTNPEIISILSSIYGNKLNDVKKGVGEAIEDLKKTKEKLDKYMEEKDYDSLEYFVDSLPYTIPVATSSMITPCSTINGEEINRDLENNFSVLIMTFLPFKDKSLIILAAFDNEKQSVKILDDLEKLRKENHFLYRKYLTFLIFHEENTFISPKFFDKKPEEWKQEYFNP